jgi:hypothetical protein
MPISLRKVEYSKLNARQKENYNFLKLSAVLADYGYNNDAPHRRLAGR